MYGLAAQLASLSVFQDKWNQDPHCPPLYYYTTIIVMIHFFYGDVTLCTKSMDDRSIITSKYNSAVLLIGSMTCRFVIKL